MIKNELLINRNRILKDLFLEEKSKYKKGYTISKGVYDNKIMELHKNIIYDLLRYLSIVCMSPILVTDYLSTPEARPDLNLLVTSHDDYSAIDLKTLANYAIFRKWNKDNKTSLDAKNDNPIHEYQDHILLTALLMLATYFTSCYPEWTVIIYTEGDHLHLEICPRFREFRFITVFDNKTYDRYIDVDLSAFIRDIPIEYYTFKSINETINGLIKTGKISELMPRCYKLIN